MADNRKDASVGSMPKLVTMKDDGYYSNCIMVETTPFDVSILFGKVRPRSNEQGQNTLVEVYERQVYLSPLQARALHDALARSLTGESAPVKIEQ